MPTLFMSRAALRAGPSRTVTAIDAAPRASGAVRVMTYNVEFGKAWPAAQRTIAEHPADVICLQEIGEEAPGRFIRASQVANSIGGDWNYQRLWRRKRQWIGNMTIVTRGRIGPAHVLHCPPSAPYGTWSHVSMGDRQFIIANIHLTPMIGGPAWVAFAWSEHHRFRESVHLHGMIKRSRLPVIALGDYNTFFPAPAYWAARRGLVDCRRKFGGRHAPTRPTYGLPFVIDHVFVTPDIEVVDYRVIESDGSDHRPVLAGLQVPGIIPPSRTRYGGQHIDASAQARRESQARARFDS